jgi:pimeloyl-ACP methyl ester carboxylesterase
MATRNQAPQQYPRLCLDLPGHGRSVVRCSQVVDYAAHLIEFLDGTKCSQAVLVGHGLGGAIALNLALQIPERVAGIGLISCSARFRVPTSMLEDAANPTTYLAAIQTFIKMMNIPPSMPVLKDRIFKQLSTKRPTLFHGDLRACEHFNETERIRKIRTALVVCGTADQFTPASLNFWPNRSQCARNDRGAGHLVMLEQPRVAGASVFKP